MARHWPRPPGRAAFHGLAGDFVRTIGAQSEADPVALLLSYLTGFGNLIGRGPHFLADGARHGLNLFVALVGETSKARKGTSWARARTVFANADVIGASPETWAKTCQGEGLSSGEGLIWHVRDPISVLKSRRKKGETTYEDVMVDKGIDDKRLLVHESEFSATLRVTMREGNTLSPIMRKAWESGDMKTMTKHSPARTTGAHVSILAHVVKDEALRYLDRSEIAGGLGNRFIWACVKRSKCLPEGGTVSEADQERLASKLRAAVVFASGIGEMRRDENARALWCRVYPLLSEGRAGMAGALTARGEAQVLRLSCIYALLDHSAVVREEHLRAAFTLWDYCERSTEFVFGDAQGDPTADEILRMLRAAPEGMTRTAIRDAFGRHGSERVDRALRLLQERGLAVPRMVRTAGRSAESWHAVERDESDEGDQSRWAREASVASDASDAGKTPDEALAFGQPGMGVL
jgi:hypothetical protein